MVPGIQYLEKIRLLEYRTMGIQTSGNNPNPNIIIRNADPVLIGVIQFVGFAACVIFCYLQIIRKINTDLGII